MGGIWRARGGCWLSERVVPDAAKVRRDAGWVCALIAPQRRAEPNGMVELSIVTRWRMEPRNSRSFRLFVAVRQMSSLPRRSGADDQRVSLTFP